MKWRRVLSPRLGFRELLLILRSHTSRLEQNGARSVARHLFYVLCNLEQLCRNVFQALVLPVLLLFRPAALILFFGVNFIVVHIVNHLSLRTLITQKIPCEWL